MSAACTLELTPTALGLGVLEKGGKALGENSGGGVARGGGCSSSVIRNST